MEIVKHDQRGGDVDNALQKSGLIMIFFKHETTTTTDKGKLFKKTC
jgi:hypothetical protein